MGSRWTTKRYGLLFLFCASGCLQFQPLQRPGTSMMGSPATDVSCLDSSATTIQSYWDGKISGDPAIGAFWGCIDKAIDVFHSRVRGAQADVYTAEEVRTLASRYFLRGAVISDRLLAAAMQAKAAFLGGPNDAITARELKRIKVWTDTFQRHSADLYPRLAYFQDRAPLDELTVEETAQAVVALANQMGQVLQGNGVSLTFATVDAMLDELSRFVEQPELSRNLGSLRRMLPLVQQIKVDLVGGDPTLVASEDWPALMRRAGQAARWYLLYKLNPGLSSLLAPID